MVRNGANVERPIRPDRQAERLTDLGRNGQAAVTAITVASRAGNRHDLCGQARGGRRDDRQETERAAHRRSPRKRMEAFEDSSYRDEDGRGNQTAYPPWEFVFFL